MTTKYLRSEIRTGRRSGPPLYRLHIRKENTPFPAAPKPYKSVAEAFWDGGMSIMTPYGTVATVSAGKCFV